LPFLKAAPSHIEVAAFNFCNGNITITETAVDQHDHFFYPDGAVKVAFFLIWFSLGLRVRE
jgi:hypothetical protein